MKMGTRGSVNTKKLVSIAFIVIGGPIALLLFASVGSATIPLALDALHGLSGNLSEAGVPSIITTLIDPYGAGAVMGFLVAIALFAGLVVLVLNLAKTGSNK